MILLIGLESLDLYFAVLYFAVFLHLWTAVSE